MWRKVVPGRTVTFPAESTLASVNMRKKWTSLPEWRADSSGTCPCSGFLALTELTCLGKPSWSDYDFYTLNQNDLYWNNFVSKQRVTAQDSVGRWFTPLIRAGFLHIISDIISRKEWFERICLNLHSVQGNTKRPQESGYARMQN